MDWAGVLGIAAVLGCMAMYEWPKIKPHQIREKIAFALLTAAGGALAVALLLVPDLPGPTELFDALFKPFSALVETWIERRSG